MGKIGHLIAVEGAPILDSDGLTVIGYVAQDLRGEQFASIIKWVAPPRFAATPYSASNAEEPVEDPVYSMSLQAACGPLQIWKMDSQIKPNERETVLTASGFITPAPAGPRDPRRIAQAAKQLLYSGVLSPNAHRELEHIANRCARMSARTMECL